MIAGLEKTGAQLAVNLDGGPDGLLADLAGMMLDE
jgi:hypothetical protein